MMSARAISSLSKPGGHLWFEGLLVLVSPPSHGGENTEKSGTEHIQITAAQHLLHFPLGYPTAPRFHET